MCEFHSLARGGDENFVIECIRCRQIQVAFGMFLGSFAEKDFHVFRNDIARKAGCMLPSEKRTVKTMVLNTPCSSLKLLFSYDELQELHRMLDEADTEMKTREMLQLFDISNGQDGIQ